MLRVLSLNLQHALPGAGATHDPATTHLAGTDLSRPATAQEVLEALARQIAELRPDVVALQEVDLGQARSGRLDQAAVLARELGWASHRFAATYAGPVAGLRRRPLRSALARHRDDPLGAGRALLGQPPAGFGNALLTRLPVTAWHVARLGRGPASVSRRQGPALDPRSYRLSTSTMRNLLAATIDVRELDWDGAARLSVASTHLATRVGTASSQLAAAWYALAGLPGPHLLAGDLNLRPRQVAATGVGRELGAGDTFPASRPHHRIDHLITDPWPYDAAGLPQDPRHTGTPWPRLKAVDHGTRTFLVSDHAGTWVDLEPA